MEFFSVQNKNLILKPLICQKNKHLFCKMTQSHPFFCSNCSPHSTAVIKHSCVDKQSYYLSCCQSFLPYIFFSCLFSFFIFLFFSLIKLTTKNQICIHTLYIALYLANHVGTKLRQVMLPFLEPTCIVNYNLNKCYKCYKISQFYQHCRCSIDGPTQR